MEFNVEMLLGSTKVEKMPLLIAGDLAGYPFKITDLDHNGNAKSAHFSPPCVWITPAHLAWEMDGSVR